MQIEVKGGLLPAAGPEIHSEHSSQIHHRLRQMQSIFPVQEHPQRFGCLPIRQPLHELEYCHKIQNHRRDARLPLWRIKIRLILLMKFIEHFLPNQTIGTVFFQDCSTHHCCLLWHRPGFLYFQTHSCLLFKYSRFDNSIL